MDRHAVAQPAASKPAESDITQTLMVWANERQRAYRLAEGDREKMMKKVIGVWLDYQEAVIVLVTDNGKDTRRIRSHLEKDIKFSDKAQRVAADDAQGRRFLHHLNQYYDNVIASIREAGFILIFGLGDAPVELNTRMEAADLGGRILHIETVDKMTDSQIGSRAQQRFQALNSEPLKRGLY